MSITDSQKALLTKYGVEVQEDVNDTLLALDDKITEIGFNTDYELNEVGLKLQRLYDDLYGQN